MTTPQCRHCGESEDMHHTFEGPVPVPRNCKCDPYEWRFSGKPWVVPPVCTDFTPMQGPDSEGLCGACEHLTECHAPEGEA